MHRPAVALVAAVALTGCGSGRSAPSTSSSASTLPPGLAGREAPGIHLADARGGRLDTHSLHGRPYALTFLYTHCPDVCPLIGSEVSRALALLGADRQRVAALAVSVDPVGDTRPSVLQWLRDHHEPAEFHYLVGSERELRPVWKAWFAAPQRRGDPESAHTAAVWLVDADGRLAGKIDGAEPFDPHLLATELRRLIR